MKKNEWIKTWNTRYKIYKKKKYSLSDLIKLNGFDNSTRDYNKISWKLMVKDFLIRTKLKKDQNLLEIGCGSGAFLVICKNFVKANYYGFDYSRNQIKIAKKALPNINFKVFKANKFDYRKIKFDIIVAHSVFQYFPNKSYYVKVIKKSFKHLNKKGVLCLMDLNDVKFKNKYHRMRQKINFEKKSYNKRYSNLKHLFFDKSKLRKLLISTGFSKVIFFPHRIKSYGNSNLRFNLIAKI